jgi:hypothetical protein
LQDPQKINPLLDFWFENMPSGNHAFDASCVFAHRRKINEEIQVFVARGRSRKEERRKKQLEKKKK